MPDCDGEVDGHPMSALGPQWRQVAGVRLISILMSMCIGYAVLNDGLR